MSVLHMVFGIPSELHGTDGCTHSIVDYLQKTKGTIFFSI